jgi:hypothetical protein
MNLELSDEQAVVLSRELHDTIDDDRYLFSPRIRSLRRFSTNFGPNRNGNYYHHPVSTSCHVGEDTVDAVR